MPAQTQFKEACKALDDALVSSRLTNKELVTRMVHQLHSDKHDRHSAGQMNGDSGAQVSDLALVGASEQAWDVLEVMRSAIGDWQTDLGHEHEEPVPLGQTLRSESQLSHALSRKQTHGRHSIRLPSLRRSSSTEPGSPRSTDALPQTTSFQAPWHLQEQGKLHRVLYRPGPEGAPFHTMLLEGILHAPVGTALCICWEVKYFPLWWPQFTVPTFKLTESFVAADINSSHALTVTRIKVPWPFATREMGMSSRVAFVDSGSGVLVAAINTIPEDPSLCSEDVQGFGPDKAPAVPTGVVRLGVDGGYVIKRISPDLCFFRGAVNVDVKLDVVPVWVINFINRTLAGTGFQVLSQVINDAVAGKKGIGHTFQKLLQAEHSLYKDVEEALAAPPLPEKPEVVADGEVAPSPLARLEGGVPVEAAGAQLQPKLEFDNLLSFAARDPELCDALGFLDEVIVQVRNDTMSMYSEMPPAAQRRPGDLQLLGDGHGKASIAGELPETPAEERKKAKKRWWKKLGFRKLR